MAYLISIGLVYNVTHQIGSFSSQRQKKNTRGNFSGNAYKGNRKKNNKPYCIGDTQIRNLKNVPWRRYVLSRTG